MKNWRKGEGAHGHDLFKGQTTPTLRMATGWKKMSLEKQAKSNHAEPMIRHLNFALNVMG